MVIREQSNTSQQLFAEYKHLAAATLYRMLGQPHNVARSKSLEYDDLLQYANLGLWQACVKHRECHSKFQSYAINHIRWSVKNGLNRDSNIFKLNPNNMPDSDDVFRIVDIHSSPNEDDGDMALGETLESDDNTEQDAINRALVIEMISNLTEREKEIIILKANDKSDVEIAESLGVSRQYIYRRIKTINEKMSHRKEDVIGNC